MDFSKQEQMIERKKQELSQLLALKVYHMDMKIRKTEDGLKLMHGSLLRAKRGIIPLP